MTQSVTITSTESKSSVVLTQQIRNPPSSWGGFF
jgi:hypothetical protein